MSATDAPVPDPETVDELRQIVDRLLTDERSRGQALDAKTSTLAGFSGAILALTATLGGTLLQARNLGDLEVPIRACFVLAVLALAVASTLAVGGVLRPQHRLALSVAQIRELSGFPMIAASKLEVQGRMMSTVIDALEVERETNGRKAQLTRFVAIALVVGFVSVGAMAVVVGVTSPTPESVVQSR